MKLVPVALAGALALSACTAFQGGQLDPQAQLVAETAKFCRTATAAIDVLRPRVPRMTLDQLDTYETSLNVSDRYCLEGQPPPTTDSALRDLRVAAVKLNEMKGAVR